MVEPHWEPYPETSSPNEPKSTRILCGLPDMVDSPSRVASHIDARILVSCAESPSFAEGWERTLLLLRETLRQCPCPLPEDSQAARRHGVRRTLPRHITAPRPRHWGPVSSSSDTLAVPNFSPTMRSPGPRRQALKHSDPEGNKGHCKGAQSRVEEPPRRAVELLRGSRSGLGRREQGVVRKAARGFEEASSPRRGPGVHCDSSLPGYALHARIGNCESARVPPCMQCSRKAGNQLTSEVLPP